MRRSMIPATRVAFDHAALSDAVRAGHGAEILRQLNNDIGLTFDASLGDVRVSQYALDGAVQLALDAQPELITTPNAGIPAFLSNFLDPKLIEVLVSPMKAAEVAGETKKGDWTTTVATFAIVESTGEVSSYGDYSNNGSSEVNTNFPQVQSYHYQVFSQWGEKQLAVNALAKIDFAARVNIASALVLNKFQNKSYLFGIDGLQNYGMLNNPQLSAPITPAAPWTPAVDGANIYKDIQSLFLQLQTQANGLVDADTGMTMVLSPTNAVNLNNTNTFNVNVYDQLRKNYPNLRVVTVPEYSTAAGELVQLIVDEYEGQETWTNAFTEKMRAHAMIVGPSNFLQKKSQGTFGNVLFRPMFIAQMLG